LLDGLLEGVERRAPELVEIRAQRGHAVGIDGVDAPRAGRPVDHQAGALQNLEVLGHRRAGDRQLARELADGPRPLAEQLEDRASGRIPECRERLGLVSKHEP